MHQVRNKPSKQKDKGKGKGKGKNQNQNFFISIKERRVEKVRTKRRRHSERREWGLLGLNRHNTFGWMGGYMLLF
jgi:hypothetical protein